MLEPSCAKKAAMTEEPSRWWFRVDDERTFAYDHPNADDIVRDPTREDDESGPRDRRRGLRQLDQGDEEEEKEEGEEEGTEE